MSVSIDLAGKVVLVTGGSDGVGAGCARVFVEAGATVAINSRSAARGQALADELTRLGPGTCSFVQTDVSDADALRRFVDEVAARHGGIDVLVNNAGQNFGWRPIDDIEVSEFVELLGINLVPYFAGSKFALPYLRERRGSIVNIGSIVAEAGFFSNPDYVATKGAISSLTKALAIDEAENGVRVNALLPGNIMTPGRRALQEHSPNGEAFHAFLESWQWLGRSGTPEEVGYAALFLASPLASFITGATLIVSGGMELGFGTKQPFHGLISSAAE
jgi:NAD(P)-dependent dehydrogenase (short-subunit alcohol dehydrogenase family)